jgi:putative salt-induced outer membrane protein YdiY
VSFLKTTLPSAVLLCLAGVARAQELCPCPPPSPPPPHWTGSIGGGFALTTGNSQTDSYNLAFSVKHDPKRKNVFKSEGLYLRSSTDDVQNVAKTSVYARDEYSLGSRSFVFGEARYFRDVLKGVEHLISPLAGLGYKLMKTERAELALDAAAGGKFEKPQGLDMTSTGAVQAGQMLSVKLSQSATLTQRATALWTMSDFGDALYHGELALQASLARRFELKLAFLDDYKTRPVNATLKKNDASIVAALVFKIG